MALRVTKNTFLYEQVNPHGQMVRREVFAGQMVPDHYVEGDDTESGAIEQVDAPATSVGGLGAAPHGYTHQRGQSVKDQLAAKLGHDPSDEEVEAYEQGGQAMANLEQKAREKRSQSRRSRRAESSDGDDGDE